MTTPSRPDDQPEPLPRIGAPAVEQLLIAQLPALTVFLRHCASARLQAHEAIEDLAQSVCREVLQDQAKLEFVCEEKFRSYLFLQAVRKVMDRGRFHQMARRDVRRVQSLPLATRSDAECGIYSSLVTGSQVASAREQLARVEQCLHLLPDAQREAILLSRVAGLSYAEIALQKGIAESSVRGLVARGLARIYVQMEAPER